MLSEAELVMKSCSLKLRQTSAVVGGDVMRYDEQSAAPFLVVNAEAITAKLI